jgi:ribosomal protein L29
MSDISQRIANLYPEKRALLELRFMKKVTLAAKEHKISRRRATVMTMSASPR